MRRLLTLMLAMMTLILSAHAAAPRVSLLTCGVGSEIYELEGHTGLRIQHPVYGDFTVNWGVFDFNSPGFVYRFVKGETDYMAAATYTSMFLDAYRRQGRTVREQTLRLDSLTSERLTEMVMENLKPENRVYRYNYVLDNCATRPLAMIEAAIGDTLSLASPPLKAADRSTFRNVMRYYHKDYPWYQLGIDTALGTGVDRPITERESSFAPVVLDDMIAQAKLPSGEPLVFSDSYLVGNAATPSPAEGPTPLPLTPTFIAWVILLAALCVSVMQIKGHPKAARWFDTVFFTICGIDGLLLTFLIFVSVHEATSPNWLYLWLNPLCLIGAVAPWLKRGKRLEIWYQSVNFALLMALTVIFLAKVQSPNPAFAPLILTSALRAVTNIYTICKRKSETSASTRA